MMMMSGERWWWWWWWHSQLVGKSCHSARWAGGVNATRRLLLLLFNYRELCLCGGGGLFLEEVCSVLAANQLEMRPF